MKKLSFPLALGLAGLLGTSLGALERALDGGPSREPMPAPGPTLVAPPQPGRGDGPSTPPANSPMIGPAPHGGPGPHTSPAKPPKTSDAKGDKPTEPAMPAVNATTLKQTTVTAHLREAMAKDKNLVWCNTMQLAWDEMATATGGSILLNDEPAMAKALNEHLASKGDIDEASYLAMGGMVKDGIIEKIQKALDAKFPDHDDFFKDAVKGDHDKPFMLISFSYLIKNLAFKTPFYTMTENPLTIAGIQVKTFGVWREAGMEGWVERADQVEILDESSKSEYIVELKTKSENDRLILARVPAGATLKETIDTAMKRIAAGHPNPLRASDELLAPVIDFHIVREYNEIVGKSFVAPVDGKSREIIAALQDTRFKLDETGAILISQAIIKADDSAPPIPRVFRFDQPFLVLMLRKEAKTPYFAVWIANTELLTPLAPAQPKLGGGSTGPSIAPPEGAAKPDEKGAVQPPILRSMPAIAPPLEQ